MTAKQKILSYLSKTPGRTLTTKQARARFKIVNVAARIEELRKDGHAINLNIQKTKDGRKKYFYSMG